MPPLLGLGALLQAMVFGALAAELADRSTLAMALAVAGGLAQAGAALALFTRRPAPLRTLHALTLGVVALLAGLFLHAGLHVATRFGTDAARTGTGALLVTLLALPWVAAWPLWAFLRAGKTAAPLAAIGLLGLLLPPLLGAQLDRAEEVWSSQPALPLLAQVAHQRWQGVVATWPEDDDNGPATVLLTPMRGGEPGATVRGEGDNLIAALADASARLQRPRGPDDALIVDVARARYTSPNLPVGRGGALTEDGGLSPAVAWRPGAVRHHGIWPAWKVPRIQLPAGGSPTVFESALATAEGAVRLGAGWAAPPALSAPAVLAAAQAGAHMLARNQKADGRFAYTVKGPSGDDDKGYNLPRHAGVTWFLARVAARTGDPVLVAATDRGLAWMAEQSTRLPDGRAYVADGRRRDGVVWVGTTALALLAATTHKSPLAGPWAAYVASAVDAEGQVRGEAPRSTGEAGPQARNPYGQGQTTLALAVALRDGDRSLEDATGRAAAYIEGGYSPLQANQLVVLDEHWACIAALALQQATGEATGLDLCRAYVAQERMYTPAPATGYRPAAGPAGGLAEAVVALAMLEPEGPWKAMALAQGELFLDSAYQAADAPFLGRPERLIGGFRDGPFDLDVRMDAVQHIGCALLGIEALISGGPPAPGALP